MTFMKLECVSRTSTENTGMLKILLVLHGVKSKYDSVAFICQYLYLYLHVTC